MLRRNLGLAGLLLGLAMLSPAVASAEPQEISAVEVQDEEGVTRIVLTGAKDPIYTAFLRENPPRLIVELPEVTFDGIGTPITVQNGLVQDVVLGAFGDPRVSLSMARVSIGLDAVAEYRLIPEGDRLTIEIGRQGTLEEPAPVAEAEPEPEPESREDAFDAEDDAAADAEVPTADDAAAESELQVPAAADSAADATFEREASPARAAEATRQTPIPPAGAEITGVSARGDTVEIRASGALDNIDSFTLSGPDRLVVDFFGARAGQVAKTTPGAGGLVSQVRLGGHPDKVRIVLDLAGELRGHRVEPSADGVRITLTGDAIADAGQVPEPESRGQAEATSEVPPAAPTPKPKAPAAPEPADSEIDLAQGETPLLTNREEVDPTPGPAEVESAHFESLPELDRIVVTLTGRARVELVEPDPNTLILRLIDVGIDETTERRVDTREFGGPVQVFSIFQTPDVAEREVRIVLKRAASVPGEIVWAERQLYLELPRGDAAVVRDAEPVPSVPSDAPAEREAPIEGASGEVLSPDDMPAVEPAPGDPGFAAAPGAGDGDGVAGLGEDDPFLFDDGPASPASIDILQEGGFSEDKQYTGRRISLDFKDADIGNILRLIAEVSDLNVIAGGEVKGTVTIRLVDVPWDQALDVVLLTRGLGFIRVGNVLRIAPIEAIKLEAEQRLQERRAKEKLEDLVVKLQPVNYANVQETQKLLRRILSKRGSVDIDKRTNTLIIKDIPSVVQEATALVKAIDTQTPQVLIEAKIVEASLSFARSLGSVWSAGYTPTTIVDPTLGATRTSRGGADDFRFATPSDNSTGAFTPDTLVNNVLTGNPITQAATGLLNLGILSLDDQLQLDLQLQAAETNNKGKVISSPRVVTIDNRKATIKQGVAIAFTEATADRITTSFIDAVLELTVTPHITADRSVIMQIKVSRNAPQLSASTGTVTGIAKNETKTEALVRDGETIVLGGIYVVDSGRQNSKVPFLADIPLLGVAFRNDSIADERRELLIFVTPRVILGRPSDL